MPSFKTCAIFYNIFYIMLDITMRVLGTSGDQNIRQRGVFIVLTVLHLEKPEEERNTMNHSSVFTGMQYFSSNLSTNLFVGTTLTTSFVVALPLLELLVTVLNHLWYLLGRTTNKQTNKHSDMHITVRKFQVPQMQLQLLPSIA